MSSLAGNRLRPLARELRRAYLQVFGIPDYERHLEHLAMHHPGQAVPSRREFYLQAMDRKYGRGGGSRCC